MEVLMTTFARLLGQLPQIIVWLVGVGLAYNHLDRSPRRARLALIAFAGFLILAFVGAILSSFYTFTIMDSNPTQIAAVLTAVNIVLSIISAGLWVVLLMALFGGKKEAAVNFDGMG